MHAGRRRVNCRCVSRMPTSAGGTPDAAREAHGRPGRQQHRARRHDGTQALRGFVPRATEWDDWRGKVDALQKEKWAIDGTADGTKPTPVVEEPYWGEALTNYSEVIYDNKQGRDSSRRRARPRSGRSSTRDPDTRRNPTARSHGAIAGAGLEPRASETAKRSQLHPRPSHATGPCRGVSRSNSRGGTRTRDPGIMSAVL